MLQIQKYTQLVDTLYAQTPQMPDINKNINSDIVKILKLLSTGLINILLTLEIQGVTGNEKQFLSSIVIGYCEVTYGN